MSEPALAIEIDGEQSVFRTGEPVDVAVTLEEGDDASISDIEVGARWLVDSIVAETHPSSTLDGPGPATVEPPPGPYTYDGVKLDVEWEAYAKATVGEGLAEETIEAAAPFEYHPGDADAYHPGVTPDGIDETDSSRWNCCLRFFALGLGVLSLVALVVAIGATIPPLWGGKALFYPPSATVIIPGVIAYVLGIALVWMPLRRLIADIHVAEAEFDMGEPRLRAGDERQVEISLSASQPFTVTDARTVIETFEYYHPRWDGSNGIKRLELDKETFEPVTELPVDVDTESTETVAFRIKRPENAPGTFSVGSDSGSRGLHCKLECELELNGWLPLAFKRRIVVEPTEIAW